MKILVDHILNARYGEAWRYFNSKDASNFIQFIKYGMAGGLAFITHMIAYEIIGRTIFDAFNDANPDRTMHGVYSYGIAFLFGNFVAYFTNIWWVFKDGKFSRLTESLLFFAISGVSVALGLLLYRMLEPPMVDWLGDQLGPRLTNLCNIVTAVLINYTGRKFFIFKG